MEVLTAPASFGHTDCERIVGGMLAQPVLAVTSLAYVIVGVAVLLWAVRVRGSLAGVAAVTLVAVGAGSFAFHGPQPSWAGLAHDLPIVVVGVVYAAGLVLSARRQRLSAWVAPAAVFAPGIGRLRRGTLRVSAVPARQPVAVPRRLARPLCHCRRDWPHVRWRQPRR